MYKFILRGGVLLISIFLISSCSKNEDELMVEQESLIEQSSDQLKSLDCEIYQLPEAEAFRNAYEVGEDYIKSLMLLSDRELYAQRKSIRQTLNIHAQQINKSIPRGGVHSRILPNDFVNGYEPCDDDFDSPPIDGDELNDEICATVALSLLTCINDIYIDILNGSAGGEQCDGCGYGIYTGFGWLVRWAYSSIEKFSAIIFEGTGAVAGISALLAEALLVAGFVAVLTESVFQYDNVVNYIHEQTDLCEDAACIILLDADGVPDDEYVGYRCEFTSDGVPYDPCYE